MAAASSLTNLSNTVGPGTTSFPSANFPMTTFRRSTYASTTIRLAISPTSHAAVGRPFTFPSWENGGPWDFAPTTGQISLSRDNRGAAYTGPTTYTKDRNLKGGPPLPEYVDPYLPLMYTSCDRIMPQGTCGLRASAPKRREPQVAEAKITLTKKREAPEDVDEKSDIKKPRLDIKPIAAGEAAKPSSVDGPVSETKPRLFVDNVTAKEALTFYEVLVESVRHNRGKIMQLETELEENERQWNEDYDEHHAKWEKCFAKKNEEVDKLKVDLALSDGLLKASKITVSAQEKKLLILEQTKNLLEEKERTIKDLNERLASWEGQARAMLGPLLGGGLSSSSTDVKVPTPAHNNHTKEPTAAPKFDNSRAPVQAPKTDGKSTPVNSAPKINVPLPALTNKSDTSRASAQVPKPEGKTPPARSAPTTATKAKALLNSIKIDGAPAATAAPKLSPYQRWDRQLNGTSQVMPKPKPAV